MSFIFALSANFITPALVFRISLHCKLNEPVKQFSVFNAHVRHQLGVHAYRRESGDSVYLVEHQTVLCREKIHAGESAAPHRDERLLCGLAELLGHFRGYLRRNIQNGGSQLVFCVVVVELLGGGYLPRNGRDEVGSVAEYRALDFLADYLSFDHHFFAVCERYLDAVLESLAVSGAAHSNGSVYR